MTNAITRRVTTSLAESISSSAIHFSERIAFNIGSEGRLSQLRARLTYFTSKNDCAVGIRPPVTWKPCFCHAAGYWRPELAAARSGALLHMAYTGASELAARGADPVMIVRMMGDSSLRTVMDHYFDSSVEQMQEVLARWEPLE